LAKLGYTQVHKLERKDDVWEATAVKGNVTHIIRFNAHTGAKMEELPVK
jgi:hypothetical protein